VIFVNQGHHSPFAVSALLRLEAICQNGIGRRSNGCKDLHGHVAEECRESSPIPDNYSPKNWFVEGSDDASTGTTIDKRPDNSEPRRRNLTRTLSVSPCDHCGFNQIWDKGSN
jgi:hypothetical protein